MCSGQITLFEAEISFKASYAWYKSALQTSAQKNFPFVRHQIVKNPVVTDYGRRNSDFFGNKISHKSSILLSWNLLDSVLASIASFGQRFGSKQYNLSW